MDREYEAKSWWEQNKDQFPNVRAEDGVAIYKQGYEDGYEWGLEVATPADY